MQVRRSGTRGSEAADGAVLIIVPSWASLF